MNHSLKLILAKPFRLVRRAKLALSYYRKPLVDLFNWLARSKEVTNFTYDLEITNKRYLAALLSDITGRDFEEIMGYFREIENNNELQQHIATVTAANEFADTADQTARYGRRIGWYALVRILKPKIIIETGIDKGLGACVLTAALKQNHAEGYEGKYYGTDINPKAGYLLAGEYARYGTILYGDSITSLNNFTGVIDLFINDSDHSADYEAGEYRAISSKLDKQAVILGDNAHCTDKLLQFSLANQRHYVYFQEKPLAHWYPGAGIGISFKRPI